MLDLPTIPVAAMTTPADLLSFRLLTGLTREEVGALLGIGPKDVRDLERMRTLFVFEEHELLLKDIIDQVNSLLDQEIERPPPEFLFCYPNDSVFAIYEPDLAEWMRYNSVHRMFIARLLDAWMQEGHSPSVAEIVPTQYQEFLRGRADTPEMRAAWATEHVKVIDRRAGLPTAGRVSLEARGS